MRRQCFHLDNSLSMRFLYIKLHQKIFFCVDGSDSERRLLRPLVQSFQTYKVSQTLWFHTEDSIHQRFYLTDQRLIGGGDGGAGSPLGLNCLHSRACKGIAQAVHKEGVCHSYSLGYVLVLVGGLRPVVDLCPHLLTHQLNERDGKAHLGNKEKQQPPGKRGNDL